MIKTKTIIEIQIGERNYICECSPESPLGELHDALIQMKSIVIEQILKEQEKEKKICNSTNEENKCLP